MSVIGSLIGDAFTSAASKANTMQRIGEGMAISGANGLFGSLFGGWNARRQRRQQEKLMAKQYEYSQKAFEQENARQDWLLQNTPYMIREGLKSAGYSPADPNGTGFTNGVGNNNVEVPTAPPAAFPYQDLGLGSAMAAVASSRLQSSEARLNEIEESWRAKKLEGEIGLLNQTIKQNEDRFPEVIANIKADTEQKLASKRLNEEQAKKIVQETSNLAETLKGIQIDNKYKDDLNEKQVKVLVATAAKLFAEGKVQAAYAALADKGIIAQGSGLAQILSLLGSEDAEEVRDSIVDGTDKLLGGFPSTVKQVITGIVDYVSSRIRVNKKSMEEQTRHIKEMQRQGKSQREINEYKASHPVHF